MKFRASLSPMNSAERLVTHRRGLVRYGIVKSVLYTCQECYKHISRIHKYIPLLNYNEVMYNNSMSTFYALPNSMCLCRGGLEFA